MPTEGVALARLRSKLAWLRREAGDPSLREIERRLRLLDLPLSYGTVRNVLRCLRCPTWDQVEWLVTALGGDEEYFRQLWLAAAQEDNPLAPVPDDVVDDVDEAHISRLETIGEADQAQHSVDERAAGVQHEMRSLIEQLRSATNQVGDLNDQLTSLNAALDQIRRQANADAAEIARLTKERDNLQKDRDLLAEQIRDLKERLRNAGEDEIDLLKEAVQIATQRVELYRGLARSEETARRRYEQDLHDERESVRALQAELAAARRDAGMLAGEQRIRDHLADAEYLARTIADPDLRAEALRDAARTLANLDPPAAERLARTFTSPQLHCQVLTLADIAKTQIQRSLPEAKRLLMTAEDVAMTITGDNRHLRDIGLAGIAPVLAEFDMDAAARVAQVIQGFLSEPRVEAELGIARAAIGRGDDETARRFLADAEDRVARLPGGYPQVRTYRQLRDVAEVAAERDPADAERIAGRIPYNAPSFRAEALANRAGALARIAAVVAAENRGNAERLLAAAKNCLALSMDRDRALGLADVAAAVTEWHPEEARRLLADALAVDEPIAGRRRRRRSGGGYEHEVRQNIAVTLARLDPGEAADLAGTIGDPRRQGAALCAAVREMAAKNLDRADGLARTISNPDYQARALVHVALARANAERPAE
jgi:archaellum component FlaC